MSRTCTSCGCLIEGGACESCQVERVELDENLARLESQLAAAEKERDEALKDNAEYEQESVDLAGVCNERDRLRAELEQALRYKRALQGDLDRLRAENEKLRAALERIQALVNRQAEDEGLWATPLHRQLTIGEAHTQQELRKLHALIEMFSKALADAGRGKSVDSKPPL